MAAAIVRPGVFSTPEAAAIYALWYISENPVYTADGQLKDQGGSIRPVEGGYSYGDIVVGESREVSIAVKSDAVGWFHSHPREGTAADRLNRHWSPKDRNSHNTLERSFNRGIKTYIGGSDGAVRVFTTGGPRTGTQLTDTGFLKL